MKRLFYIVAVLALVSCANRGIGPQGGPKDSIPPKPLKSDPEIGALNFQGKRIEVTFDEYIQLDNVVANMLMSPPQQNPPDVKARGKRLIVNFQDTLYDNTTYTIDFGNAVCDFREKVPLRGYSFYFSTGSEIDTLEYRGRVYDAQTLNPRGGVLVGIHRDLSDTAFTSLPFLRIAKTDSAGYFRIGNIHPGTYRLYAVDDISRDYRLTLGEAFAFADEPIEVTGPAQKMVEEAAPMDSMSHDTLSAVDSVPVPEIPLTPLFLFKEQQQKLYLQRTLRDKKHCITMLFSSSPDSLPSFRAMRPSEIDSTKSDIAWVDPKPYMHMTSTAHRDTVVIWLTDSVAISQDSIFLEARYRRTDSLYQLEWCTDTLRAIWRAPRLNAKAQEAQDRQNRNRRLELKSNARKDFELYDTLRLVCSTPLASIALDSIHLLERVDTVLTPVPFTIAPYDTLPQELLFFAELKAGGQYELRIDSAALHDVYGISHIAGNYPLQVKSLSDYSTLRIKITPFTAKARIQILNNRDQVIRELPAAQEGTLFEYLKPDAYYVRLYMDENGDGKWTTGEWSSKRQPEAVYYFPNKIQTKSNWDFEEEWDYTAIPQTEAKPRELIKAAPKK